jgi:hypothetical protein
MNSWDGGQPLTYPSWLAMVSAREESFDSNARHQDTVMTFGFVEPILFASIGQ